MTTEQILHIIWTTLDYLVWFMCGIFAAKYRGACHSRDRWRETVRDLYDRLHFGDFNVFKNEEAREITGFIEDRHNDFFCQPAEKGGE